MTKVLTVHHRNQLVLPFQRVGVEKHHEGMDLRIIKLAIDPGAIPENENIMVCKFLVDPSIEKDLLVSLSIKGMKRMSAPVTASLIKDPFARAILLKTEDLDSIYLQVKPLRDLEIICALATLVSTKEQL